MGPYLSLRSGIENLLALALLLIGSAPTMGNVVATPDGLSAQADGIRLSAISVDGGELAGLSVSTQLLDPETNQPVGVGFSVNGEWTAEADFLKLSGVVEAEGAEDRVADLLIRIEGAQLALESMTQNPLLQPSRTLSKLPLVSLRVGGQDALALAVPPDALAVFDFRQEKDAVVLRFPFGFTNEARPELRMRAPFTCVLYRTDPRWHFRSALQRYYEFFPKPFEPFVTEQGGWFFAAPTQDLPNPQHFYYHEGGPGGWDLDDERGLGTYPYKESSSYTVSLPGDKLPGSYEESMQRFDEVANQIKPLGWDAMRSFAIDADTKHSGARSILADAGDTGTWVGVGQTIKLNPPVTKPIVVRGFSKAEGITGSPDHEYSIYVDVVYESGGYLFGQCASFATGTHDWEASEYVINPAEPVAELRSYCLLRNHHGKAWFDDIHIGPADEPETNWFKNASFEEDERNRGAQFVRDNVCYNSLGEYVVRATDNLSSDVAPSSPMNLLRFTLNVDPDIPDTEEKPSVAALQFEYYDEVFKNNPSVDGCYIDSVSAWCSRVLNCRRDQWPYHDVAFTYDPANYKVSAHGIYAMADYLGALQERYHPLGKPVFTNIHTSPEAFPLYLVSDVPGIESSQYRDEDWLFFHRACSYQKPLLLLNFMNLHDLDKRPFAEAYHLNAALWGEFPSTGRYVQRAYREYGDVTHAYVPAIKEVSAAGWEPVPLASGVRVERFGGEDAAYFTVRAPEQPAQETLIIDPEALAQIGDDPVAFDAVRLCPMPLEKREDGWAIPFTHGENELHIVRVSARQSVISWLLGRARQHAVSAARVQGKQSETPELLAAIEALSAQRQTDDVALQAQLSDCRDKLAKALGSVDKDREDLYSISRIREVLQARATVDALAAFTVGARIGLDGPRTSRPGKPIVLTAVCQSDARTQVRLVGFDSGPGRSIVPTLESRAETVAGPLTIAAGAPGTHHVTALFEIAPADGEPFRVAREMNVFFLPAASLKLEETAGTADARSYTVEVDHDPDITDITIRPQVTAPATAIPAELSIGAAKPTVTFEVRRTFDGLQRELVMLATDAEGNELARAQTSFLDELPAPADDLALASLNAKATTESDYGGGYSPEALIDGVTATEGLHWTKRAWASQDNSNPHWLQIDLPRPTRVSKVIVFWNQEGGRVYTAQEYKVIALTDAGPREVASVSGQPSRSMTLHEFEPVLARSIRIEQAPRGGPENRPGIMWVREVCVLP